MRERIMKENKKRIRSSRKWRRVGDFQPRVWTEWQIKFVFNYNQTYLKLELKLAHRNVGLAQALRSWPKVSGAQAQARTKKR